MMMHTVCTAAAARHATHTPCDVIRRQLPMTLPQVELLRHYHERLVARGVRNYDFVECAFAYVLSQVSAHQEGASSRMDARRVPPLLIGQWAIARCVPTLDQWAVGGAVSLLKYCGCAADERWIDPPPPPFHCSFCQPDRTI